MPQQHDGITRRTFIRRAGAAGVAIAGGTLRSTAPAAARARNAGKRRSPVEHLVISMQENRSFDHYFGFAGKMDGFYRVAAEDTGSGDNAIFFYTQRELPFYYSLFRDSGPCANYFCSLLGPTWPNRFYLMAGTSGGITTNGLRGFGIFDSTTWPIILDLLDEAEVTWKIHYIGFDSVENDDTDHVAVFWSPLGARSAHDCDVRRLPRGLSSRDAPERVVDHLELLDAVRRASGRRRQRRDGLPAAGDQRSAGLAALAELGVPAHLRRARRVLRPRPAAAG
jgi:phospholipase C